MKCTVAIVLLSASIASAQVDQGGYPDCQNGPLSDNTVCDSSAAPADRAAALVQAMTLDEKFANLVDGANGSKRLGLPTYEFWSEALHGVAYAPGVSFADEGDFSNATSFPMPMTMSASFHDELILEVGKVIGLEGRAFGNAARAGISYYSPDINPFKDPRWGRGQETPGEDPLHIARYTKNVITGMEGGYRPESRQIVATCKHFAANDLEAWGGVERYGFNAIITPQDLAEYYLVPFQQCARDNRVGSVMCSYNAVNGVPACANAYLMEDILRKHWDWQEQNQFLVSDCNAVGYIYTDHHYTPDAVTAAGDAYRAGVDNICDAYATPTNVSGAYALGLINDTVLDRSLRRQYEGLARAGYVDSNSTNQYRTIGSEVLSTPEHQAIALQVATEGIVLLKNQGDALPMQLDGRKVALIGMWANGTEQMQGIYQGRAPYLHSPLYAAEQLGVHTSYATGPINETATSGNWTEPAMSAADDADVILFFGGIDSTIERETLDRYQIGWPQSQLLLIEQLASLGKPMVVSQLGSQIDQAPLLNNANISGVIWAGYPGQDGGTAVMNIITGKTSPAGRLPLTNYPADYVNEVPMTNMNLRPGADNPGRTYKWYDNATLPFGYGLSYTNFKARYSDCPTEITIDELLKDCTETHKDLCAFPDLPITIENVGNVTSDFVALSFSSGQYGPKPYPLKSLHSYTRLAAIEPGESREGQLEANIGALARRDEHGDQYLYPGEYKFMLDVPTQAEVHVTLTGEAALLDKWPVQPEDQGARRF